MAHKMQTDILKLSEASSQDVEVSEHSGLTLVSPLLEQWRNYGKAPLKQNHKVNKFSGLKGAIWIIRTKNQVQVKVSVMGFGKRRFNLQ